MSLSLHEQRIQNNCKLLRGEDYYQNIVACLAVVFTGTFANDF